MAYLMESKKAEQQMWNAGEADILNVVTREASLKAEFGQILRGKGVSPMDMSEKSAGGRKPQAEEQGPGGLAGQMCLESDSKRLKGSYKVCRKPQGVQEDSDRGWQQLSHEKYSKLYVRC